MKNITIFKNYHSITEPYFITVECALNRIKTGKDLVSTEIIRAELDKAKRNELKKKLLPAILFAGRFERRADTGIIEHSGKIILDFDDFKDADEVSQWRENLLKSDKGRFILALFLSPSGLGIKILVSIPAEKNNHKKYFEALENYFSDKHWDKSGKNLSRICFGSYDPDLYFNPEAEQWCEMAEEEPYIPPPVPENVLQSEIEKVKHLDTWFKKKYSMNEGEKNNNLYILASAHNDLGVSKQFSEFHLFENYGNVDTKDEILKLISSAFKKPGGTKHFENRENTKVTIQTGNDRKQEIAWENVNYTNKDRVRESVNKNYPYWISFVVNCKYTNIEIDLIFRNKTNKNF